MFRILLGIILGIGLALVALFAWLRFGTVPVAVADPPLPQEQLITGVPLHSRIDRELVRTPPVTADEATFVAGAHIYSEQCAVCHGYSGKPSAFGKNMFPDAPQLWEKHGDGPVVGVSDDPPGETYWKVANGIRLSGMPSYKKLLTEPQMWQVSVLLANADKPLPPDALYILRGNPPVPAITPTPVPEVPAVKGTQGAPLPPL